MLRAIHPFRSPLALHTEKKKKFENFNSKIKEKRKGILQLTRAMRFATVLLVFR